MKVPTAFRWCTKFDDYSYAFRPLAVWVGEDIRIYTLFRLAIRWSPFKIAIQRIQEGKA